MSLRLEPFAISITLSGPTPRAGSCWADTFSALLGDLTRRIEAVPGNLIGHLKLRGDADGEVYASAVSGGLAPQVSVDIQDDTAALSFNLVCLVYGMSAETLRHTVEFSLDYVARLQGLSFVCSAPRGSKQFSLLHVDTAVTRVMRRP